MGTTMSNSFWTPKASNLQGTHTSVPGYGDPYILFTDASHYVDSGVLTQAVESPEDLRPIAFTSGSFSERQQRWSAAKKEAYIVYQSVL